MKQRLFYLLATLLVTGLIASSFKFHIQPQQMHYNVLFIFVDDLRPDLGCYGNKIIRTPNIDALAAQGTLFKNQFVTVPTCGASRASILTGLLPRHLDDLSNDVLELRRRKGLSSSTPESFVHLLKNNGYYTVGIGKVSHSPDGYIYKYLEPKSNVMELPNSWDEMLLNPGKWGTGWNAFFGYADGNNRNALKGLVKPYENTAAEDTNYPDGLTAELALQKLDKLSKNNGPFFLGVGFFKPHLPFNAPQKYWDLYKDEVIPLTPSPEIPKNVNNASLYQSGEFNGYKNGEAKPSLEKPVSDDYARKLKHAYYAAVSYSDAQIGKILNRLKQLNLDKNTIVVLWGDHGWHLGDDRVWGKHTITEWAVRSPLIIKSPGMPAQMVNSNVVSSVNLYATLMQLCNVKMPFKTDGQSFVNLLQGKPTNWNDVAYSYYNKGITMRNGRYRLTKYFRAAEPTTELYDHATDPLEKINIAAVQPEVVKQLMPLWEKGNTKLYDELPKNSQEKADQ